MYCTCCCHKLYLGPKTANLKELLQVIIPVILIVSITAYETMLTFINKPLRYLNKTVKNELSGNCTVQGNGINVMNSKTISESEYLCTLTRNCLKIFNNNINVNNSYV